MVIFRYVLQVSIDMGKFSICDCKFSWRVPQLALAKIMSHMCMTMTATEKNMCCIKMYIHINNGLNLELCLPALLALSIIMLQSPGSFYETITILPFLATSTVTQCKQSESIKLPFYQGVSWCHGACEQFRLLLL